LFLAEKYEFDPFLFETQGFKQGCAPIHDASIRISNINSESACFSATKTLLI